MTQREMLESVLKDHGATLVKDGKWRQWTTGNLLPDAVLGKYFFLGMAGGFRCGVNRTHSADRPHMKARLMAEWGAAVRL